MKNSLSHLPENKQHEITHIAEIIREVVNPEMIILFGSYAKGTYVDDQYIARDGIMHEYISDYDFLVITRDNPERTYVQESKIMDKVDRYKPPINLEIHDIHFINEGLEMGEYFFFEIINDGIFLFDKKTVEFSPSRKLTSKERKEKAQRYFENWFPQGKELIEGSKFFFNRNNLKSCVFLLHQATESLYYTTLLVFIDFKPKTHNLWKLRKKAKPFSEELFSVFRTEIDKQENHLFDLLKRGYVDARYRLDYSISREELIILIERISKMELIVERLCNGKINSFDGSPQ